MQLFVEMTNIEQILRPLQGLNREMGQVVNSALRRAGTAMRTSLGKLISQESYLKGRDIKKSIRSPRVTDNEVTVSVSSHVYPAYKFKLVPNRITARKGKRSKDWPVSGFRLGPRIPVRIGKAKDGYSRPFVLFGKESGELKMLQRNSSNEFRTVAGASVQYFSVFPEVSAKVMERGREVFEKQLMHEVEFRLGKMK